MENKEKMLRGPLIAGILGVVFIVNLGIQVSSLKGDVRELKMALRTQEDQINQLETRIDTLYDQGKFVKKSSYHLSEASDKLGQNDNIASFKIDLSVDNDSEGIIKLYYKASGDNTWQEEEMAYNLGEASLVMDLSYAHDYEMKVGYISDGKEVFELLPSLDIYTKESMTWDSDIETHSVKKQVVDYTIQVGRFHNPNKTELDSIICELYYDETLIDQFELQDFMAENDQKEPRAQLEHGDDYWYANRIVSIPTKDTLISEKIRYEVIIKNNKQTSFERTYFVE